MKAAFFNNGVTFVPGDVIDFVYAQGRRQKVAELSHLHPTVITSANFESQVGSLQDLEVIFSSWGMPALTPEQIAKLPSLKAVFYAAGSIKGFARPFLEKGIFVCSAWLANAVPVAEFCVGQILLGMKGYFRNTRDYRNPEYVKKAYKGPGNYGDTVALIGMGGIGKKTLELLAPYNLNKIIVSRYMPEEEAARLGVKKVTIEEAFAKGFVVSNHLADLESNKGVIDAKLLRSMRPGAVFINTGRGAQVNEKDLVEVLRERSDLTALLDVTVTEPPVAGSAMYDLPNIQMTTHIAGSNNDEVIRMADWMIEEYLRLQAGQPLHYAVSLQQLDTMA